MGYHEVHGRTVFVNEGDDLIECDACGRVRFSSDLEEIHDDDGGLHVVCSDASCPDNDQFMRFISTYSFLQSE